MTYPVKDTIVWCEVPVTDLDAGIAFYGKLFDQTLSRETMGPNDIAWFPKSADEDVAGHIYEGTPATNGAGMTAHFHAPDTLEATIARMKDAGAEILGDVVALPFGRFQYAIDPFGNSIAVFSKLS